MSVRKVREQFEKMENDEKKHSPGPSDEEGSLSDDVSSVVSTEVESSPNPQSGHAHEVSRRRSPTYSPEAHMEEYDAIREQETGVDEMRFKIFWESSYHAYWWLETWFKIRKLKEAKQYDKALSAVLTVIYRKTFNKPAAVKTMMNKEERFSKLKKYFANDFMKTVLARQPGGHAKIQWRAQFWPLFTAEGFEKFMKKLPKKEDYMRVMTQLGMDNEWGIDAVLSQFQSILCEACQDVRRYCVCRTKENITEIAETINKMTEDKRAEIMEKIKELWLDSESESGEEH